MQKTKNVGKHCRRWEKMWTREELKTRAKAGLKFYYWYGFLVCFVAGLLGGAVSAGPQFSVSYNQRVN